MDKRTRYSPEVRDHAVRLVLEHQEELGSQWQAIRSIATKIGCTAESLRQLMFRIGVRRGSGVLVLVLTTACGGGERPSITSTITDSAGVSIVTSTGSVWGEGAARLDTNPLLRIGAEEAGPYQFSFISAGLLLDGEGVAVVELSANEVRLFDADGRHLRSVGRRGRGPGEFQVISGLFRKSGDSLAAYDQIERRVTIFPRSSGEPRVVRSRAVPGGRGNFDAFGALGDGRLLLYNPGGGFRPDLQPGLQWVATEVVVLDPVDGTARTIARLPSRQQFILPGGDTKVLAPAHGAIRAVSTNGFYWGTSDRYDIRYFDSDGNLRRILRRPVEPRPVVPAMIEAWIEGNLKEVRKFEGDAAVPRYRQRYEEGSYGDRAPLFDRAFVDSEERLWVGASEWPAHQVAPVTWSIFAPNGTWLGDIATPPQFRVLDCRDDLILGVWQQEGEAPFVRVHRLLRP